MADRKTVELNVRITLKLDPTDVDAKAWLRTLLAFQGDDQVDVRMVRFLKP